MNEIEHDPPRLNENFTLLLVLKDRKTFHVSLNEIIAKKKKKKKWEISENLNSYEHMRQWVQSRSSSDSTVPHY